MPIDAPEASSCLSVAEDDVVFARDRQVLGRNGDTKCDCFSGSQAAAPAMGFRKKARSLLTRHNRAMCGAQQQRTHSRRSSSSNSGRRRRNGRGRSERNRTS